MDVPIAEELNMNEIRRDLNERRFGFFGCLLL